MRLNMQNTFCLMTGIMRFRTRHTFYFVYTLGIDENCNLM
jgi:hypothetical protein